MKRRVGVLAALLLSVTAPALALESSTGRQKAQACAVCHGLQGLSSAPDAPNLAGQPQRYLAAQLRAYRSAARQHEQMSLIAKPLSDAEIEALATWFAAQQIELKTPL